MIVLRILSFFFNDTATTEIYTLSLHDALPIFTGGRMSDELPRKRDVTPMTQPRPRGRAELAARSEEHTSELQSRQYLVCRLLLEKKKRTSTKANQNSNQHICSVICSTMINETV